MNNAASAPEPFETETADKAPTAPEPFEIETGIEGKKVVASSGRVWSRRHLAILFAAIVVGINAIVITVLIILSAVSADMGLEKSELDFDMKYAFSQLDNGLHMLVGTKENADMGAASLCWGIGYLSEPPEWPGLLHLIVHGVLEHEHFAAWAKRHGGTLSYSFDQTSTCFAFDSTAQSFHEGATLFVEAFKNPILERSTLTRGIIGMEQSYNNNHDHLGRLAVWLHDMNPAHPEHYPQGRASKLMTDGLDKMTLDWFTSIFDAHDTRLAVISPQPISEMSDQMKQLFGKLPGTLDQPPKPRGSGYVGDTPPFLPGKFEGLIYRKPHGYSKMLDLFWCLSDYSGDVWRTKPWIFAMMSLSWEGDGGLESYLKHKGWIRLIDAHIDDEGTYTVFHISIPLTDEGVKNIVDVGAIVFEYISFLRSRSELEVTEMLQEEQILRDLRFRYHRSAYIFNQAVLLAENMLTYPEKYTMSGPVKIFDIDAAAHMKLLGELKVESARVMLTAPAWAEKATDEDANFQAKFHHEAFEGPMRDAWNKAEEGTGLTRMDEKRMIPKSPYLPVDTTLVASPSEEFEVSKQEFEYLKVFSLTFVKFLEPVVYCRIRIYSLAFHEEAVTQKAINLVRAWLWGSVLCLEIDKELHDLFAMPLTKYSLNVNSHWGAMDLSIHALGNLMPIALERIARLMTSDSIGATADDPNFAPAYDMIEETLQTATRENQWPFRLNHMFTDYISSKSKLDALEVFKKAGVPRTSHWLFERVAVEALMVGNILPERAADWSQKFVDELKLNGPALQQPPHSLALTLKEGKTFVKVPSSIPDDPDSGLAVHFQVEGDLSCHAKDTFTDFLRYVLRDRWRRFSKLLGTNVRLDHAENLGKHWLVFSLETMYSPTLGMKLLHDWLEEALKNVQEFTHSEFVKQKEGFLQAAQEKAISLHRVYSRYSNEFGDRHFTFDSKQKKIDLMLSMSLSDFVNFVHSVQASKRLYLEITATSKGDDFEMPAQVHDQLKSPESELKYDRELIGLEQVNDGSWYAFEEAKVTNSDLSVTEVHA